VQGVGFRPYVYNLAKSFGLCGFVRNSSSGVVIAVEGEPTAVEQFVEEMRRNPPALARIEQFTIAPLDPSGAKEFVIQESLVEAGEFVLVSPDVATCADCWADVTDPNDRRYGYPFTNCTNCGPRYTIVQDIPYDRPLTTMSRFRMCSKCEAEYHDPGSRRFHAQPNACPICGPTPAFGCGGSLPQPRSALRSGDVSLSVLRDVRRMLHDGCVVAIKGLGGFHLACDAENAHTVELLRRRKKRSDKPFALMSRDLATATGRAGRSPENTSISAAARTVTARNSSA
jgi:hydrogenase maturation protein HypF